MLVSGLHCAGKEVRKAGGRFFFLSVKCCRFKHAMGPSVLSGLYHSLLVPCKNIQTGSER